MNRISILLALFVLACTPTRRTPVAPVAASGAPAPSARFHGGGQGLPAGRILDAKTGREVSFEQMIAGLTSAETVYVGEIHDQRVQHEAQLWVLKGLFFARPGEVAVGMEMFQRPFQNVLDLYLQGEIGERALLRESEYESRWGYDFSLYRPILRFALDHGVAVLALNAPTEWVRRISSAGLEGLSPEERAALPELDLNDAEHRARVKLSFDQHPHGGSFERFYTIQTVWDETMADSVARFQKAASGARPQVVVLAGHGHVDGGSGIPKRVARRTGGSYKIVVPISVPEGREPPLEELLAEGAGDYLWLLYTSGEERRSPHGKSPHKKSPHD